MENMTEKHEIIRFDTVDSTNKRAREYLSDGVVVVANAQTEGRGRRGRTWLNTKGALLMSIVVKSKLDVENTALIGLASAAAVYETLNRYTSVCIKWPNDIITMAGKKLCGILSECVFSGDEIYAIIGIGINVNASDMPADLTYPASSVYIETGKQFSVGDMLDQIINELDEKLKLLNADIDRLLEIYRKYCITINKKVLINTCDSVFEALAVSVDKQGRLVVKLSGGETVVVSAADVSVRMKND